MIIKYNLSHTRTIRFFENIIALPESVKLVFESDSYVINVLLVTINGQQRKVLAGRELDVSEFFKKAGKVEISVAAIEKGVVLKSWTAETILVKEIDTTYQAIPEVVELSAKIDTLSKAVAELAKIVKEDF